MNNSFIYFLFFIFFFGCDSLRLTKAENLKIHGSLINSPCKLLPGDDDINVIFNNFILKELYENNQGWEKKEFIIVFSECDISVINSFKIKFSGIESPTMKGFLAVDQDNLKQDVAIGIETGEGFFLPINQFSSLIKIAKNGRNDMVFRAYLKPTKKAIDSKKIKKGNFSAKAIFTFAYN
ncbi:fimbrial protein [Moellerella wisconsensis]|uniref:Type 1 fimbrial protein n=1 Tax=Moellerella wisconsensis TaxID=158849 RepID=A0A9Q8Q1C2_9GAMM|nr:fimbrial protein [Moellerella wisconsensis]UNH30462.1 type 1 fimbrial protein [Moellerella wisconsensis]